MRLTLYEKADCGLCAEAYGALARIRREIPLDIERVDILIDPALFTRYALRIPVLRVGDAELDAAGVDQAAVRRWLTEVRPPLG